MCRVADNPAEAVSFVRSDEQSMLASTLRDMLSETVDLDAVREMSTTDSAFDAALWSALTDMGVVGLHIPEADGGAGMSLADVAVVAEQLGRVVGAVPFLSSVVASSAVLAAGDEAQRGRHLPDMASGVVIPTLAVFESAHADIGGGGTHLTRGTEGWRLSGTKRYVTDATSASKFVVVADIEGVPALAVVSSIADGVSVEPTAALDATRPLGTVTFEEVPLADSDVIPDSAAAVRRAVDVAAVLLAAEQVGGAQRCLEMSVEYAKSRYQFGRAIGSFQAVKHMCADMLVAVEHARSAAWHAAVTFEDPTESAIAVPLARSVCSDAYIQVAGDTIQVLGGIGFTWEHDAHLYFKRAKSTSLLFGSVDHYRDRLAEAVGF